MKMHFWRREGEGGVTQFNVDEDSESDDWMSAGPCVWKKNDLSYQHQSR